MSKGFKYFMVVLSCFILVFITIKVIETEKEKRLQREGERIFNTQKEWVNELIKIETAMSRIFDGCGLVKFGSDPTSKLGLPMKRNDPFAIVYEFESVPESCLMNPFKIDQLTEAVLMLREAGMAEMTFVDYRSRQPILKYSVQSGWTNFTKIPIEFPK